MSLSCELASGLGLGALLCDVRTPALLLDHTGAATWRGLSPRKLDEALNDADEDALADLLYVHTSVVSGRDVKAGAVGSTTLAQRATPSAPIVLATLDCAARQTGRDAFVGLGLNNHFTGGYYWGRSSGPGAAMPAPGVALQASGEQAPLRLLRLENSNDGKRSEWCEFLAVGDQMQIVLPNARAALAAFDTVVGVTRDGHRNVPRGAEPIVEAAWTRRGGSWERTSWSAEFAVQPESRPQGARSFLASWGYEAISDRARGSDARDGEVDLDASKGGDVELP